jgi:peroxiredoxin
MDNDYTDVSPADTQKSTPRPRPYSGIFGGVLVGIGLGLILLAVIGQFWDPSQPAEETAVSPQRDSQAPNFMLSDLSGQEISLSDLRGRVVLINFWATWCGPCQLEMPALQSRYEMYEGDLTVLAVDFDEPADLVQDFVDEYGLTFDVLLDPGASVQQLYRVLGYPTSVFVDEQGVIRIIHVGIMAESQLDSYLGEMGLVQ